MSGKGKQSGGIVIITTVPGGQHATTARYAKATTTKNSCAYSYKSNSQQVAYNSKTYDRQSRSYAKATVQQSSSTGDVFKGRSTTRLCLKGDYKATSTLKVGDKTVYTEYQVRERLVRRVYYGSGSGSKKCLK